MALSHEPKLGKHVKCSTEVKKFRSKLKINVEKLTEITQSFIQSKYAEVESYCSKAMTAMTAQTDKMIQKQP